MISLQPQQTSNNNKEILQTTSLQTAQLVKNLPAMQETSVRFLGGEDLLQKGSVTHSSILGLPFWLSWSRNCLQCGRPGFDPWVGKIPWRRERLPTPVFWPGEFYGLYSPRGCKESDTTDRLSLWGTFLLSSSYLMLEYVMIFLQHMGFIKTQLEIISSLELL